MNADNGLLRKAQKYIASSRLLCDSGDYDSAISRLYYAAFYLAEALLEELGLSFSSHKGVISAFGQEFAKTAKLDPRFHRLLISTFEKRQRADYLTDTGLDAADVEQLLVEIDAFQRATEEWLGHSQTN